MTAEEEPEYEDEEIELVQVEEALDSEDPKVDVSLRVLEWVHQVTMPCVFPDGTSTPGFGLNDKNVQATARSAMEYLRVYLDGKGEID